MNLGQTMITMGMFVLLVMSVISANRMLVQNNELNLQTEALTASATIANDLLQEALSKRFDEFSDTTGTQPKSDFSPPGGNEWGPSAAEQSLLGPLPDSSYTGAYRSIPDSVFNDLDDYNGYTRLVTENNISGFLVTVAVYYVNSSDPDVPLTTQNTYKKIEITVEHPQYLKPVKYSAMLSY